MKVAYLITAYNNPVHLRRLVNAIITPSSAAYVHVDAKSQVEPFQTITHEKLTFVEPRIRVFWGEFSMVEAILTLIRAALSAPTRYDYLVLISGTDYPIRPIRELESFLASRSGTQFMNIVSMPNEEVSKPLSRLRHYKVLSGSPLTWPLRAVRRALIKCGLMRAERSFEVALQGRTPYAGSTWWALTREACEYVLEFVAREPSFVAFYRNTWFPDEGMIHTIIGNSPFASRLNRNLTYTDWTRRGPHPMSLGPQHVTRFIREPVLCSDDHYGPGEVFFARKFSDETMGLVAQLDDYFLQRERAHTSLPQHGHTSTAHNPS